MADRLKVLIIEDSPSDAALVARELSRGEHDVDSAVVSSADDLATALADGPWDIVLSDYAMPQFDAVAAFNMVRDLDAEMPFVVVSGTVGEERAVELMRLGVTDYVLKDKLTRLNDVVDRAMKEAHERHALEQAEKHLLSAAYEWHKTFDAISDGVLLLEPGGTVRRVNAGALKALAADQDDIVGDDILRALLRLGGQQHRERIEHFRTEGVTRFELGPCREEGLWFDVSVDPVRHAGGELDGWVIVLSDVTERKRSESELRNVVSQLERTMRGSVSIASHMVEKRDPYTAGHQEGVAKVAVEIAEALELPAEQVDLVRTSALLHDIGKIAVPAEILVKPGRLDQYEWLIIQRHPQVGAEILEDAELSGPIADIIRQHHERLDGSGYPSGLTDDEICFEARILAVADVTEAMLAHRPYRPARTLEQTIEELRRGSGTLYDPRVVDACLTTLKVKQ